MKLPLALLLINVFSVLMTKIKFKKKSVTRSFPQTIMCVHAEGSWLWCVPQSSDARLPRRRSKVFFRPQTTLESRYTGYTKRKRIQINPSCNYLWECTVSHAQHLLFQTIHKHAISSVLLLHVCWLLDRNSYWLFWGKFCIAVQCLVLPL